MCLGKIERTYLFLPFGTALVRQPHYAGGRCADVDHLQDALSQRCEYDAAVCESAPKESASFVSTRLRSTAFASSSTVQGLVRASTMFQHTNFHSTLNYSSVSVRTPRIRAYSFHLIPTSFFRKLKETPPTILNSYRTLICLTISSMVKCLI